MKYLAISLVLFSVNLLNAQHTFSIVAIDSVTGEIGSAGATCGDSIIWPGTPGALIISDIIPGVGAIHTQALYTPTNQANAHTRMVLGDSPADIITWLVANDNNSNPGIRQYGIVDYNNGSPRSAAHTGANCLDYKNHITGPNYSIQGNILLGQQILDSMESRFNNTTGCLSDKLMAAMQGANVVGADTRCTSEGTSSLSAFLRVANPSDHEDTLYLDLNIAGTASGMEPIDALQSKYDNWKLNNQNNCSSVIDIRKNPNEKDNFLIGPNPTSGSIEIRNENNRSCRFVISDINGNHLLDDNITEDQKRKSISLDQLSSGIYFISFIENQVIIGRDKLSLAKIN